MKEIQTSYGELFFLFLILCDPTGQDSLGHFVYVWTQLKFQLQKK